MFPKDLHYCFKQAQFKSAVLTNMEVISKVKAPIMSNIIVHCIVKLHAHNYSKYSTTE